MPLNAITADQVAKINKGREPLPNGVYTVEVIEAKEETAPSGKDYLALTLRVIEDEDHTGRRIWTRLYLNEEALVYTLPALMALTGGQYNPEEYSTADAFMDCTCRVTTKERTGNDGVTRNDVDKWMPLAEDAQSDTQEAKASISAGKSKRANAL